MEKVEIKGMKPLVVGVFTLAALKLVDVAIKGGAATLGVSLLQNMGINVFGLINQKKEEEEEEK